MCDFAYSSTQAEYTHTLLLTKQLHDLDLFVSDREITGLIGQLTQRVQVNLATKSVTKMAFFGRRTLLGQEKITSVL